MARTPTPRTATSIPVPSAGEALGTLVALLEKAAGAAAHEAVSQEVRDFIRQAKRETYFLAQNEYARTYGPTLNGA